MAQLTEKRTVPLQRNRRFAAPMRMPPVQSPRPRNIISAKAVGSFVPALTRKVFEKHGFAAVSLVTEWSRIVGPDLAAYTFPERLKWPQGRHVEPSTEGETQPRPAATLILRVDPARALDAEYKARLIMDRTNTYFGYRAVGEVRIVQAAPDMAAPAARAQQTQLTPRTAGRAIVPVSGVEDQGLATALGRLKASMDMRPR